MTIMSRRISVVFIFLLLTGCAVYATQKMDQAYGLPSLENREQVASADEAAFFNGEVKPILDRRCVSCHACYDSPCQLKLTSKAGIERGLSKDLVYDGTRLLASDPTRLYIDAQSLTDWRKKGFNPVLNERSQSPSANLNASVLFRALSLRREQGDFTQEVLGDEYDFALSRDQQCPTIEEYNAFEKTHPHWGMPYGLPALTDQEHTTITRWLVNGGVIPDPKPLSNEHADSVSDWESRFNLDDLKHRLVSRYVYEHIYLYSLYLDESDVRFRLVRSKTPPGEPVSIIATRRPYDDPKVERVYYRLVPERETKVQKNHIPLALTEARYDLWMSYLYSPDYQVESLPSYDYDVSTNPFKAFGVIPSYGRYRFLLEHAQNTIMAFIKGPVCRGQVAVNVINEQFWVYFVNPEVDYRNEMSVFLNGQAQHLDMPAELSSNALPISSWVLYSEKQKDYMSAKAQLIEKAVAKGLPIDMSLIWDGDKQNQNAALTVFRHFDNATVVKGLVGEAPKTAWVIDYPLLERIHYLLVAGFDVYGNVGHQLVTRLYMDFLRMEGEMNFLLLLPKDERDRLRQFWYREANQTIKDYIFDDYLNVDVPTNISYGTGSHKRELIEKLSQRLKPVLNQDYDVKNLALNSTELAALQHLALIKGGGLQFLPEVSVVLITDKQGAPKDVLSVIHNRAHLNISSLLDEEDALAPEEDTVTLAKGVLGDYPNVFMTVSEDQVIDWVHTIGSMESKQDYVNLLNRFGVRRTNPSFWQVSDAIGELNKKARPMESGVLDYNRLENR
ncbi:fatty acid cis/trans isomerase [Marinomonas mediterranea]|uniref:Fatty acid cistrans isomerase n=1 Tax=Marinomonas mediterranea (strain ATCC 700492 / JCM 21426 / NBRC 103028 / MMB-1) TaxID=717774 RepID=F2JZW0_MARM1|nr:fatty acid cis/trans isomerase [Marinomonas mediterranea]ADZ92072.1 fatty acid cistrans isomerase [Marinomonas mediterranea MMB-1]